MRARAAAVVTLAGAGALTAGWFGGLEPRGVVALPVVGPVASGTVSTSGTASTSASAPPSSKNTSRKPTKSPTRRPSPGPPSPSTSPGTTPPTRSGTATGSLVQTPYGTVQVRISFSGNRITDATATHLTDSSGTSVAISAEAAPVLRQEALSAQSAQIDLVSGATFTSEGYRQSLQAAIDAAHLRA